MGGVCVGVMVSTGEPLKVLEPVKGIIGASDSFLAFGSSPIPGFWAGEMDRAPVPGGRMTCGHPSSFARTSSLKEVGGLGADRAILGSELGTLRACQGLCARLAERPRPYGTLLAPGRRCSLT